jgi:hypothetical protein
MTNKVIVFDIDGTLADVTHRRQFVATKPKNWAAWNAGMARDTVHQDIADLARNFAAQGHRIILCSGRGGETRSTTEQWCRDNDIPFNRIYMRPEKDHRQDSIVKSELLDSIRQWEGEPWLWFDDRQQVVDAIRAKGVRVLQVAPGDF